MRFMLLIVEPPEQRAGRTEAEGRDAYARMQRFGESLRERGQLVDTVEVRPLVACFEESIGRRAT